MKVFTDSIVSKIVEDLSGNSLTITELKSNLDAKCLAEEVDEPAGLIDDATEKVNTIDVNFENCVGDRPCIKEISGRESSLLGYHEINGFPFYGFNGGGDWEVPLYGIMYMKDGDDSIYYYIPLRGNIYNPTYMSAFGNNDDDEEGEDAACDFDMIMDDIKIAFNLNAPKITEETSNLIDDIKDAADELIEAVSALSDETVGNVLKDCMNDILDKITTVLAGSASAAELSKAKSDLINTTSQLSKEQAKVKDLTDRVTKLNDEVMTLKTAAATPTRTVSDDAIDEIAKIIASVKSGMGVPAAAPTPAAAPAAPAKPLKKITLPSKSISYEYVYGVELNCGEAVLHIVKTDDFARDQLAKEGRVDTDTIARLKKEISLKRNMFLYTVEDKSFSTIEEAIDFVNEAAKNAGVNLTHSEEAQKLI